MSSIMYVYDDDLEGFRPLKTSDLSGGGGGGGGGGGADRELVVTTYRCKTAFTGASVGDTITATQIIDVTGTPTTVSTVWRNQTTAADLGSAPAAADLELVGSQALTDAQLRASAVATAPNVSRGAGSVDENTQRVALATDSPGAAGIGAQADAAAASDGTGNYSIIAGIKRGLLNWATLLGRIPALVSGRVPVDGSGVTQPVSAASLPLPTGASTSALQTTGNTSLSNIDTKLPSQSIAGLVPVDTLAAVGVARQLAAGSASVNTALTTTCRRISIHARGADIRYVIGTGAQVASGTSHFVASGERLDIDVAASSQIAVIRAGSTDGTLEVSELVIA